MRVIEMALHFMVATYPTAFPARGQQSWTINPNILHPGRISEGHGVIKA
jgi:hypothetical protein